MMVLPSVAVSLETEQSLCPEGLVGRWIRPDGGYVIEVKEIGRDGTMKAAYFNPRPVNVARGACKRENGKIALFIELQDVNYPGSTYNLRYDHVSDRLIGTYFQALHGITYHIEFVRIK